MKGYYLLRFRSTLLSSCGIAKRRSVSHLSFQQLGIRADIEKCLTEQKIVAPTEIQAKVLPKIIEGQDVIINSETGSGKTLCYALPVVEKILRYKDNCASCDSPFAIILVPNVELAVQAYRVFQSLSGDSKVVTSLCLPGSDSPGHCDVLVATPNELSKYRFDEFTGAQVIVLDEADFLLHSQLKISCHIMEYFTGRRLKVKGVMKRRKFLSSDSRQDDGPLQFVFAGATLPANGRKTPLRLALAYVPSAQHVTLDTTHCLVGTLTKSTVHCEESTKVTKLIHLLSEATVNGGCKMIVFVNTVQRAKDLHALLVTPVDDIEKTRYEMTEEDRQKRPLFASSVVYDHNLTEFQRSHSDCVGIIHKHLRHTERRTLLDGFNERHGGVSVLISTDLASRGIDFTDVGVVVQFDFPLNVTNLIHRAGRTARQGAEGSLVTFVTPNNQELEDLLGSTISQHGSIDALFSRNSMLRRRIKANTI